MLVGKNFGFDDFDNQLIQNQHNNNENTHIKLEEMKKARNLLEWAWYQEVEAWIVEKLQAISDETVKDAANIQVGFNFFSF